MPPDTRKSTITCLEMRLEKKYSEVRNQSSEVGNQKPEDGTKWE
jgi:hypothetical protein